MVQKKVAFISEHASPLADPGSVDSGGQNVYVAQTARYLARQGYHVDIFTRCDDSTLPDIVLWEDGVRVIHVPAGPAEFVPKEDLLGYMEPFTTFLVEFIHKQEEPYELIHAHFWMSALVAANIKQALGIPFVVTFHALGRVRRKHQGKDDGFPDMRFQIEDGIVQEADYIIAECPQDEEDLIELYNAHPEKLVMVPCGFSPEELQPLDKREARRRLGLQEDERVVLQLGRMVPRKGIETSIRGFARLVNEHGVPAQMLVVGGASEEPDPDKTPEIGRLKEIAEEEDVQDRVKFVGRRGREALKYYYSAADVFISTPWYEPFGITPVESMACGTPVIGSKVGGIQYTVAEGETGFLVHPKDPEAVGKRLATLYQQPELLERMQKQAVDRANQLFTWERVSTQIADLYETIIADKQALEIPRQPVIAGKMSYSSMLDQAEISSNGRGNNRQSIFEGAFQEAAGTLKDTRRALRNSTEEGGELIAETLAGGGRVFVAGNGGSAADAQHFAAEFVGRFIYPDRPGLPVMPLNADSTFLTAWSNDVGYEQVFARQLEAFGKPGDLLLGISTSGRSENLNFAFKKAHRMGITTIALIGKGGGDLGRLADLSIVVPSDSTQRIQEMHLLLLHVMAEIVEEFFVSESSLLTGIPVKETSSLDLKRGIPVELPGQD